MTGTDYRGEDDFLGAREAVGLYGEAGRGGMIRHVTYPGHFISEIERVVAGIAELADDPLVKVIVVSQAVPGTAEGFREVKSKRPDIIRLAGEAHEDPRIIARAADLVANSDFVSRGHRLALLAKKMGAGALVHISSFIGTPTSSPRDTRAGPASKSPKNTCGLESASGTRRRPERRFPNVRAG